MGLTGSILRKKQFVSFKETKTSCHEVILILGLTKFSSNLFSLLIIGHASSLISTFF